MKIREQVSRPECVRRARVWVYTHGGDSAMDELPGVINAFAMLPTGDFAEAMADLGWEGETLDGLAARMKGQRRTDRQKRGKARRSHGASGRDD